MQHFLPLLQLHSWPSQAALHSSKPSKRADTLLVVVQVILLPRKGHASPRRRVTVPQRRKCFYLRFQCPPCSRAVYRNAERDEAIPTLATRHEATEVWRLHEEAEQIFSTRHNSTGNCIPRDEESVSMKEQEHGGAKEGPGIWHRKCKQTKNTQNSNECALSE